MKIIVYRPGYSPTTPTPKCFQEALPEMCAEVAVEHKVNGAIDNDEEVVRVNGSKCEYVACL